VGRQKQNIELAEKVYDEAALKYREDLASMSNLLQGEMSLNAAQANYLTALSTTIYSSILTLNLLHPIHHSRWIFR
jgi:outer membrane protein TolC